MSPTIEAQKEGASKALYAIIGAPVVTGRKLRDLGTRLAGDLATEAETWEAEGRKLTGQIQESKVVEQVQSRVDVDQLQEQVEKLRDQLESALANWRSGFKPNGSGVKRQHVEVTEEEPVTKPATKTAPKKPATKTAPKTTTKKPATES